MAVPGICFARGPCPLARAHAHSKGQIAIFPASRGGARRATRTPLLCSRAPGRRSPRPDPGRCIPRGAVFSPRGSARAKPRSYLLSLASGSPGCGPDLRASQAAPPATAHQHAGRAHTMTRRKERRLRRGPPVHRLRSAATVRCLRSTHSSCRSSCYGRAADSESQSQPRPAAQHRWRLLRLGAWGIICMLQI